MGQTFDQLMGMISARNAQTKQRRMENDMYATQMIQQQASAQIAQAHQAARHGSGNTGASGTGKSGNGPPVVMGGNISLTGVGNLILPIKGVTGISDDYGYRTNPVSGAYSFHEGVDFPAGGGTPIRAVSDGIVKVANKDDIYGNQVFLGLGHGWQTQYGHMSKSIVHKGQRVHKGQIIGYVGSTGWSTGNHLHFGIYHHGSHVNPHKYYKKF